MQPDRGGLPFFLSDAVTDNRRWVPDQVAMICGDRQWSWAEFADDVDRLQHGLSGQGVRHGSRVAVLDRNSGDYVLLGYALAGMGAVLVPVNMWLRAPEITYILNNCQPTLLVTSDEFLPIATEACAALLDRPGIVVRGQGRGQGRGEGRGDKRGEACGGATPFEALREALPTGEVSRPLSWDDPHLILYTSGTTGRPKGAIISHRRTVLDALNALPVFGIQTGDRFFCYMPLFHTGAWDYLKLFFMQRGSAVIAERFEPENAVTSIARHRCTAMFGVPVVLRQMVESVAWQTADLSSMRLIAYANYDPSSLILRIVDAFRARGASRIGIANAYGLTEGGPYICILRPADALARPLSIGTPVPGVQVGLLDEQMRHVPPGELGEICIRSPALMSGYLNRPEATAEAFAGGWLHTGDLGRVDAEGFVHLVDRKKDMIRTGGENVFAKEVEQTLVSHPGVRACAVVGLPDADYGEQVVAVVVAEAEPPPAAKDLISFVRDHIAGFKAPREIVFIDEFPKTPAGKIKKHELRKMLLEKADRPAPTR